MKNLTILLINQFFHHAPGNSVILTLLPCIITNFCNRMLNSVPQTQIFILRGTFNGRPHCIEQSASQLAASLASVLKQSLSVSAHSVSAHSVPAHSVSYHSVSYHSVLK